jgi:transposase-like protein
VSTRSVMGITATGRRRNHSWPEALKREIVAATFAPGASVSVVARHYDVNANQVFSWRKRYRDDPHAPVGGSAPQLIPVTVRRPRRRRRSRRRSRLILPASTVSASATALMRTHCGVYSMCWSGDDPGSLRRARLACGWANGYEARHEWLGSASPGSAATRSSCR